MGEVRTAHDPRLGRDVAVKTVAPGDAASAVRLEREAAITARLEHPGIMPVYAAGRDRSGRPWYAMRRFVGRSLADAIHEAPDLAARLRLVKHVLDAGEAVAYAHDQGVLHRDLKPANVMTGSFGETLVADWGLAVAKETAARGTEEGGGPPGGGTPGYMSPEQESGAPLDERADVYALGACLFEVLTGQLPGGTVAFPPDAPPELVAIAQRALRPELSARYPSARAFVDDLLAWFEARRVSAHEYSILDFFRRLWRAWRVPLPVAIGVLASVALAVGVGAWRASTERARAVESERVAAQARIDEQSAFAAALRAQAATALQLGLTLEARVLAVEALARREDPDARGFLAAVYGRHDLDLVRAPIPIPECRRRALSLNGRRAACLTADHIRLFDAATGEVLANAPLEVARLEFADDDHLVAVGNDGVIWRWSPPALPVVVPSLAARGGEIGDTLVPGLISVTRDTTEVVVDTHTGAVTASSACVEAVVKATAIDADKRLILGCHDRRIWRVMPEGPVLVAALSEADGVPVRLVPNPDGRLLVGTYSGVTLVVSPEGEIVARRQLGEDAVWSAVWAGDRLFVTIANGTEVLWDTQDDTVDGLLAENFAAVAWLDAEHVRVFGAALADRAVTHDTWPHRMVLGQGITAAAFTPDGSRIGVALGDGRVPLIEPRTGAIRATLVGESVVAKDLAFSPDGQEAVVARTGQYFQRYSVTDGRPIESLVHAGGRRVVWLEGPGPLLARYGLSMLTWPRPGQAPVVRFGIGFTDMEAAWDRKHVAALTSKDALWVGTVVGEQVDWRWVRRFPFTTAVASLGDTALVATPEALLELAPDGSVRWEAQLPSQACTIGVSADGTLVALGFLDGTVSVWRRGAAAPFARLLGHRARLGPVFFSADGRWLATGGWDGELRLWSVPALTVDPLAAVREVEAVTGLTLDDVLATVAHAP